MRLSYVGTLASMAVVVACATGEDIVNVHVNAIDAGPQQPITEDTGGSAGSDTESSGGTVGSGGTTGTGDVTQTSGGSPPATGGTTMSGGKTGSGGTTMSGGKTGSGGAATGGTSGSTGGSGNGSGGSGKGGTAGSGTGGSGDAGAGACQSGQKSCGGVCTPPAPRVGCGTTGCDPCTLTAPQNGYVTCTNNACAFDCLSGYTKMGDMCMGSGNGQGGAGSCNASKCAQNCSVIFGPACCTSAGKCGCPAIPYVAPTCI
ncbi:MAG TPA: hypothetical protein VHU80_00725 [Polyangiaceae bacterium]|jgi:hypothetical protein|nr:hypothetical protein [Polyangiaceae bacterium]